jgi:hypothetical protein
MENKIGMSFFFVIIGVISLRKLLEKFNFQTLKFDFEILKFDDPLKSIIFIIYVLGFVASIIGLIMNYKNQPKK